MLELNLETLLRCNLTIKFRGAPHILNLNEIERQNREGVMERTTKRKRGRENERERGREREREKKKKEKKSDG